MKDPAEYQEYIIAAAGRAFAKLEAARQTLGDTSTPRRRCPSQGASLMAKSIPEGWHTVTPRLVAHDPAKLVQFLKHAFGASGNFAADAPSQIKIGDSIVMVSGVGPRNPMPAFLYLYVDDIDATYQRALEAGAVSLEEPRDVPYGDRRAMVKDPCGNDWQIATHKGVFR